MSKVDIAEGGEAIYKVNIMFKHLRSNQAGCMLVLASSPADAERKAQSIYRRIERDEPFQESHHCEFVSRKAVNWVLLDAFGIWKSEGY